MMDIVFYTHLLNVLNAKLLWDIRGGSKGGAMGAIAPPMGFAMGGAKISKA